MKLVIEIPEQFAQGLKDLGLTDHEAGLLIREALGEFISARHPVADYVKKRYPRESGYSNMFLDDKDKEVQKRIAWAICLKIGEVKVVDE